MKTILGLALLAAAVAHAKAPAPPPSVQIKIARIHEGLPVSPTVLKLEKSGAGFKCSTKSVPLHGIKVKGLTSLEAPFKSQKVFRDCAEILTWGTRQICYKRDANPLVDAVIESCLSI